MVYCLCFICADRLCAYSVCLSACVCLSARVCLSACLIMFVPVSVCPSLFASVCVFACLCSAVLVVVCLFVCSGCLTCKRGMLFVWFCKRDNINIKCNHSPRLCFDQVVKLFKKKHALKTALGCAGKAFVMIGEALFVCIAFLVGYLI